MDKDVIELENLLKEARAQAIRPPAERARALAEAHRTRFTDPANWRATQQVQLVHREGNVETLVGIFDEFLHLYARGARRLVAARLSPTMKPRIEYVQGDHWIGRHLEQKRRTPDRVVEACEDLVLDCGPVALAALVKLSLVGGGIARVYLSAPTVFESNTPRTLLALPAEMDVLEGLTRDTKERLWRTVQLTLKVEDEAG